MSHNLLKTAVRPGYLILIVNFMVRYTQRWRPRTIRHSPKVMSKIIFPLLFLCSGDISEQFAFHEFLTRFSRVILRIFTYMVLVVLPEVVRVGYLIFFLWFTGYERSWNFKSVQTYNHPAPLNEGQNPWVSTLATWGMQSGTRVQNFVVWLRKTAWESEDILLASSSLNWPVPSIWKISKMCSQWAQENQPMNP